MLRRWGFSCVVDKEAVKRWVRKVELDEGKFEVRLSATDALMVMYRPTTSADVEEVVKYFKKMGLRQDEHFTAKWFEEEKGVTSLG